ncbi:MAG: zinc ribbon domain-containing protein [Methanoregula sp.]
MVQVPEKKKDRVQNYGVKVPVKEPIYERATAPLSPKPASVHPVKTIEICAQCGNPITDKNRIFCQECGANIREVLSGEMSSIVKHSVLEPIVKPSAVYPKPEIEAIKVQEPVLFKGTSTPVVYPKPEIEAIKVQEPVLFKGTSTQGMGIPSYPKANKWRSIFILAGIALLFFILMLTLLLMFP